MKNSGFLQLQRDLLSQPQIADMYAEEGATGLGLYVALNLYLSHCGGGWGTFTGKKLTAIAVEAHRHRGDVKRIIEDYDLFIVDTENNRFTSPWIQQQFNKCALKMHQRCATPAHTYSMRAEEIELKIEKKDKQEKCVCLNDTHSVFETLRAGKRYASHGQPLPVDAPPQRRRNDMYSYIRHDWVPVEEFNKQAEMLIYQQLCEKDAI
jgi:hypothetical protein